MPTDITLHDANDYLVLSEHGRPVAVIKAHSEQEAIEHVAERFPGCVAAIVVGGQDEGLERTFYRNIIGTPDHALH